jgi:hypothetical protein
MKSVDKVIQILREMMVANAPGSGSGFSTKSPEEGPVAGKDTLIGTGVKKRYIYGGRKSRKNWIDHFNKKS